MNTDTKSGRRGSRTREMALAAVRGLVLALAVWPWTVVVYCLALVSLALIPVGVGLVTTPWVMAAARALADNRRELAQRWCGIHIPSAYRPLPATANPVRRTHALLRDTATWRDLRWLMADTVAGLVTVLLPVVLVVYPLEGLALAAGLWRVVSDGSDGPYWYADGSDGHGPYWYAFVPVHDQATAIGAGALAVLLLVVADRFAVSALGVHFRMTRALLAPGQAELAERVKVLTDTRRDAVDTSAAELRRIERDLHDGAQARLVAMGMDLGTIEMLLDKDPEKARQLLAQTRQSSAEALAELRDLVRGIHPPVLAERGLGDAVRALALRLPVPTEVAVDVSGRAEAPVESAAYFAVSEILTNAVKHSGADRIWADLHHAEGRLRISVTDNGRGGAVIGAGSGSGLAGVERRLGTFDGVLAVSSPAGGPTMVTMEIPCALS
ncbi:sensor histidine kinase [Streptomyces sp. DSM 15324]|uniref:sensor histidine kinase n=1 Tax=Streptomyces sp. DSM 15324 TaxID=1739111 RepID=UPI00074A458E|nr:sensor domain-containing protein [Streptomyces sp. DSM 15324]KUO13196.1 histidine kinase [Streptomyces sp. DSM 15324]